MHTTAIYFGQNLRKLKQQAPIAALQQAVDMLKSGLVQYKGKPIKPGVGEHLNREFSPEWVQFVREARKAGYPDASIASYLRQISTELCSNYFKKDHPSWRDRRFHFKTTTRLHKIAPPFEA
jgi:hypothetical protein